VHDPQDEAAFLEELQATIALLERVVQDRALLAPVDRPTLRRLMTAAGRISRPERGDTKPLRRARKKREKALARAHDEALLDATRIRRSRAQPVFATPSRDAPRELEEPVERLHIERSCYVCKASFDVLHPFYDSMCATCGDENLVKRTQTADLSGRTALLTGGRVKIGYQAGIKLLRAGARLIVTTRFPHDAAERYAAEEDAAAWLDRLVVYGLDLRNSPAVEAFCKTLLATEERLDFIVNNACQTVRRPPGFYGHLMDAERDPKRLSAAARAVVQRTGRELAGEGFTDPAEASQIAVLPDDDQLALFPTGRLDADLQQVDLREVNSWRLLAHEVPTVELLEVQLVNAVAPYILNARLRALMNRTPDRDKHIVNVSAMEGQFYRTFKTARHPHTNMAKAALNMLTRTVAPDYVRDGIHVNAVDTGWITDEDPAHHAERKKAEHRFHPPLDIVDGAARIVGPIMEGIATGEHVWGRFLKDYRNTDW